MSPATCQQALAGLAGRNTCSELHSVAAFGHGWALTEPGTSLPGPHSHPKSQHGPWRQNLLTVPSSPGFLLLLTSKSPVAQFDFSAFHHLQQTLYIPFPLLQGQWFLSFWLDSDTVLLGE